MSLSQYIVDSLGYKSDFPVKFFLVGKKNSSAVFREGEIIIRLSKRLSKSEQVYQSFLLLKRIEKRIGKDNKLLYPWQIKLEDGEVFECLGHRFMIHIIEDKYCKDYHLKLKDKAVFIKTSSCDRLKNLRFCFYKSLRRELSISLSGYLQDYVGQVNAKTVKSSKINKIRWKEQLSRWGSCSCMGNINISSRLLFMPAGLLEYVVVHELCHLVELNHSKKFWRLVETFLPDYKERQKMFKKFG